MIKPTKLLLIVVSAILLLSVEIGAQELTSIGEKPASDSLSVTNLRAKNIIMMGLGTALINRDIIDSEMEQFAQIQYKRFLNSNLNINGNLKKFDINDYNFETKGFLSGDLNVEWYVLPDNKLSPFVFLGAGILTSNDFNDQNYKSQGGIGFDYLITNKLAIVGSWEANYIYDEQKGSQLIQEADQLYFNALLGLHFYVGRIKSNASKKLKRNQTSIINSNPIEVN